MHGGLSPDLQSLEQIRRVMRPTDVPDTGKKEDEGGKRAHTYGCFERLAM